MKMMLTLGIGALALATTVHALPCDKKCEKACGTVADAPHALPAAHGAGVAVAPHALHVPHAAQAGHAPRASRVAVSHAAPAPLTLATSTSLGGGVSCQSTAPSACSVTVKGGGVAVAPSSGPCQARVDELATAIDAALGVAPLAAPLAAPGPHPAALAGGANVQRRDVRSLEQRVAELERELAQRASPDQPAPPSLHTSWLAAPRVQMAPQVIRVPSPTRDGVSWFDNEDGDEDEIEEVEDGDIGEFEFDADRFDADGFDAEEQFGFVLKNGDGPTQVRWFGTGDDEDEHAFTIEGEHVTFATPDGHKVFDVRSGGDTEEVRVEIVTPDGRRVHTETVRPGRVAVIRPDGDRVEALVERLNARGHEQGHEQSQRVREEVERALQQAERARERAEMQALRATEQAQRATEQALRTRERNAAFGERQRAQVLERVGRSGSFRRVGGGDTDARDAALREVHDLMKEMREEIEGLRVELREMRHELRSTERDLHFGGEDEGIR